MSSSSSSSSNNRSALEENVVEEDRRLVADFDQDVSNLISERGWQLVAHCFDVLVNHFDRQHEVRTRFPRDQPAFPLFVTWRKREANGRWSLRGCVGTFSALKLEQGLKRFSLSSALKDKRFSVMRQDEIRHLRCEVSLLTDFEEAEHRFDWVVGVHGIQIDFEGRSVKYTSTYLPQVAVEQGWSQDETLNSLIRKAGYNGRVDDVIDTLRVTRYKSAKHSLTFDEYHKLRTDQGVQIPIRVRG